MEIGQLNKYKHKLRLYKQVLEEKEAEQLEDLRNLRSKLQELGENES